MEKTIFKINGMDCPSEENLVRVKLDGVAEIRHLDFDIPNRQLTVFHDGQLDQIEFRIDELDLDSKAIRTEEAVDASFVDDHRSQRNLLWIVLAINFGFFAIEITTGLSEGETVVLDPAGIRTGQTLTIDAQAEPAKLSSAGTVSVEH